MKKRIQELNPEKKINTIIDNSIRRYGYIVEGLDTTNLIEQSLALFEERNSTKYIPSNSELEALPVKDIVQRRIFGELPIQIGCCYGMNTYLNGMEYHATNELIIAATDLVLMLGHIKDIDKDGRWDSLNTQFFYLEKGQALTLFSSTLHLAPCRISKDPFNAIIILPRGTNGPLESSPEGTLFKFNKWMLAHKNGPAARNGAAVFTTGINLELITD